MGNTDGVASNPAVILKKDEFQVCEDFSHQKRDEACAAWSVRHGPCAWKLAWLTRHSTSCRVRSPATRWHIIAASALGGIMRCHRMSSGLAFRFLRGQC